MDHTFLDTLAHVHEIPAPAMKKVAARIAERCALIANRYATLSVPAAGSDDPVGAHIGAAILAEFEVQEAEVAVAPARER